MSEALKLGKKKSDPFEMVDFVHDKTPHQLKVIIRGIWKNMLDMATTLEDIRPDITEMIDNLLEGHKINPKHLREAKQFFKVGDAIVEYNSVTNTITILNNKGKVIDRNIQGYDKKIVKATLKLKLDHDD